MCIRDRALVNFAELYRLTKLKPDSDVLDYGCGLGRLCIPLKPYFQEAGGTYQGIDTDAGAISYLKTLHPQSTFSFNHVDIYNKMYNKNGQTMESVLKEQLLKRKVDIAFLFSVFTHVLPEDFMALLKFLKSSLKDDGQMCISFFILNEESYAGIKAGTSHRKFAHPYKNAKTDTPNVPEGAIAYEESDLFDYFKQCGLIVEDVSYGKWSGRQDSWHWQDLVVLRR